jgi:HlyD family secretion protein
MNTPGDNPATPEQSTAGRPAAAGPGCWLRLRGRRGTVLVKLAVLIVVVGLVLTILLTRGPHVPRGLELYAVRHERVQRTLEVRGEVAPAQSTDIVCRVKAIKRNSTYATTIKWVIEEGTLVRRGQVLMELDESGYVEDLKERAIRLEVAQAAWQAAEEEHTIVLSQNTAETATAETAVALAELDLDNFVQGENPQKRKELEGQLALAVSNATMWRDRAAWADRMGARDFITRTEARGEAARSETAAFALDKLLEELRVYHEHTAFHTRAELEGLVVRAKAALVTVRKQSLAREAQVNAKRLSLQRVYRRYLQRYRDIEAMVRNCVIRAPHDGIVIYALSAQNRYSSGFQSSIISQGETVREGQLLLCLPDLSRMIVRVGIHEAVSPRVRADRWEQSGFGEAMQAALLAAPDPMTRLLAQAGFAELRPHFRDRDQRLVAQGQPALVRVPGCPGRVFNGHVEWMATLPTRTDWGLGDNVYEAHIAIDDPPDDLRPDMSAEVTLLEDGATGDMLTVPVEAIVRHPASDVFSCFVLTPHGPQEREIQIGPHTDEVAAVLSGLDEGDQVVLNPEILLRDRREHEGFGN